MTPMTMNETFPRVLSDGGATPSAHDARRTATGVVACRLSAFVVGVKRGVLYLQHLDERNAQVEVCLVTTDQTQAEEETDGQDSAQIDFASHLDRLSAIEEGRGSGEDLCHQG